MLVDIFKLFLLINIEFMISTSADPDEMSGFAASHLHQYYLLMFNFWDATHNWYASAS